MPQLISVQQIINMLSELDEEELQTLSEAIDDELDEDEPIDLDDDDDDDDYEDDPIV